jgi:uncharacterized membrane protein YqjE
MTAQAGSARGLFESLSALATTLLAMAQTRLALLAEEAEAHCQHWLVTALLALGGLLLFAAGLVLGTLSLVMAFWETHRVLVLGVTAGAYGLAGIAVWAWLLHRLRSRPRLFAASLVELAKDRQQLAPRR